MSHKKHIMILGGGFGGVYTAKHLEKLLKKDPSYQIFLINKENYFVYQPMLPEVVGGAVGMLDTVSPIKRLLKNTRAFFREIHEVDLQKKTVSLQPYFSHTPLTLAYEHLVFALGNVTDFRNSPGLHEHAFAFKNLADAIKIRNHLIETIETAATYTHSLHRKAILTYVVAGGGFSGTELVAELNDLVRRLAKRRKISQEDIKVYLVHSKDRLMEKELTTSLARYAEKLLKKRGVNILFQRKLTSASPSGAILDNGERIESKTVISSVPSATNPVIQRLDLPFLSGKIQVDASMQVQNHPDLWAIGDCAAIPDLNYPGKFCPPTAQFAIRQAKTLAQNIYATLQKKPVKQFHFKSLGMMGALGHHRAVAELFGVIKISGFLAWLLWRTIYWIKLPGIDRKIKVAFSWFSDMLIPIEAVQMKIAPSQGIASLHFETNDYIFAEGDLGDFLYIIVEGEVEISKKHQDQQVSIAKIGSGEFFGEMALLNQKRRSATAKALCPTNVLAIRNSDFGALLANFQELKKQVQLTEEKRKKALEE